MHLNITFLQSHLSLCLTYSIPLLCDSQSSVSGKFFFLSILLLSCFHLYPFLLSSTKKKKKSHRLSSSIFLFFHVIQASQSFSLSSSDKILLVPLAFYPQSYFKNFIFKNTKIIFHVIFKFITLVNSSIR